MHIRTQIVGYESNLITITKVILVHHPVLEQAHGTRVALSPGFGDSSHSCCEDYLWTHCISLIKKLKSHVLEQYTRKIARHGLRTVYMIAVHH